MSGHDIQRQKWDKRYLGLCRYFSTSWSKDKSTQVGAVITNQRNEIVSLGYNGFPRGVEDKPELYDNREEKYKRVLHAEQNAFITARENLTGYNLYVWPFQPCNRCALEVIQQGILTVITMEHPRKKHNFEKLGFNLAEDMFKEAGVQLIKYPENFLDT